MANSTDKNRPLSTFIFVHCIIQALASGCRGNCSRLETTGGNDTQGAGIKKCLSCGAEIIGGGKNSAYKNGFKRCTSCGIYIKVQDNRCPCCKHPLRVRRRSY